MFFQVFLCNIIIKMIEYVYIHIPFCLKKCHYCAFCSFEALKYKSQYLKSLKKEIEYFYKNEPVKTIYFGGGTPSLLEENEIKNIIDIFNIQKDTEITLELNPYKITSKKIKNLKDIGINRLSIGIQCFDNEILASIGRLHTKEDIFNTINYIKELNFKNTSIDLIYGLPNQNIKNWNSCLDEAINLDIEHISLYGLKIEKGTKFYKSPPKNLPDDDMQSKMYDFAIKKLQDKFVHYEFSNFAKNENYFSKHNLCYWKRNDYYGFGLSASGLIKNKRYTNTFNLKDYINNPKDKTYSLLNTQQQIEEEIFLGLRIKEGINFNKINEKYNIDTYKKYQKIFDKYINLGYFSKTKNGVKFSTKGILISNEILCEFIEI